MHIFSSNYIQLYICYLILSYPTFAFQRSGELQFSVLSHVCRTCSRQTVLLQDL
jgi:hypothetical protein